MIIIKVAVFIAVVLFALIFAYYNLKPVKLIFFNYSLELPFFLYLLISFVLGFLIAYVLGELRAFGWRRYSERLREGLKKLWLGYPSGASKELSKLVDREEIVPLYMKAFREIFKIPSLYLQRYESGIAETSLAEILFRKERDRAKDLLEKALGKNLKNLRAKRMLRSIYFLEGDHEKAVDLQRSLLKESEKELREEERRVLASMLANSDNLKELEKLPLTPLSLAVLSSQEEAKRRKRFFLRAFEEGLQDETLLIMIERNLLSPEVLEVVEENKENLSKVVLALLYTNLGMYEKIKELKDDLPDPIRIFADRGLEELKECYQAFSQSITYWECEVCGKEYRRYTPVCQNCLSWNRLGILRRE